MPKVTSKLQLTVPKAIADQYGIHPGDELEWVPAGDVIRVAPTRQQGRRVNTLTLKERLKIFDESTKRQSRRESSNGVSKGSKSNDRGWRREELYRRGLSD
jgi:AbrB family looped-hinge helix DNA binding protein